MTTRPVLASNTQYLRHYATLRPHDVAIIDGDIRITWRKLAHSVIQFSLELRDLGVGPDMLVGLQGEDRFTHWLLIEACAILGATSVSLGRDELDAKHPITRHAARIFSPLPVAGHPAQRITIEWIARVMRRPVTPADWDLLDGAPHPQAVYRLGRSSGTTGEPKLMAHKYGVELRISGKRAADLRMPRFASPRFLCLYNFTVRITHLLVAGCLNLGGTVIFSSAQSAPRDIARHAPDVTLMLPASAEQTLAGLDRRFQKPRAFALAVMGAPVSPGLRQRLLDLLVTEVNDIYGSNEAAGVAEVDADGLGVIHDGVEVQIVDDAGRVLPYGEFGAIRVRTPDMVDGYLNSRRLTAERFRDGWFHPGDAGIMPAPGRLRVLGRIDNLINLGGVKLVPDRIEADLLAVAGVGDAAVVGITNGAGVAELAAAVVLAPGVAMADIAAALNAVLARHASAHRVVAVQALPRTEIGKLRRGAVAEQLAAQAAGSSPR